MDNKHLQELFDTLQPFLKDQDDIETFNGWRKQFEEGAFLEEIKNTPSIQKLSDIFEKLVKSAEVQILGDYAMDESTRLYLYAYRTIATQFANLFKSTEKGKELLAKNLEELKKEINKDKS